MGFLTKIVSILRKTGKEGQHTVEYAVLMILIMAGIITMGRYVIRSWNANLKGWEDSAIDSMEDPLLELPPPPINSCTWSDWSPLGCGLGLVNACTGVIVSCAPTEMTSIRTFNPPGCQCAQADNATVQCASDGCCCEPPTAIACGSSTPLPGSTPPPACSATGMAPTSPGGTCPFGTMGSSTVCGGSTYYGCIPDPSCLIYCPIATLTVSLDGATGSFPQTPAGSSGSSSCPFGYSSNPGGPPTRPCINGIWGGLQNPCIPTCGDGFCDALNGENCYNCTPDCGFPIGYGYGVCP
jgi:hypothetical protein